MQEIVEVIDSNTAEEINRGVILEERTSNGTPLVCKVIKNTLFGEFERNTDGDIVLDSITGSPRLLTDAYGQRKVGPLLLTWVPRAMTLWYNDPIKGTVEYHMGAWVGSGAGGGTFTGENHYHDAFLIRAAD